MEEKELNQSVSQQENVPSGVDYIEAIKEMKQNTVSKEAYEELRNENKQLLSSLINGETLTTEEKKEEPVDINALRSKLFDKDSDMSNLDYISNALELRDALIAKGEMDPFLPYGEKIIPTDDDITTANRVADVLKDCIDRADGNSDVFTNELQRVMVDSSPIRRGR